jgi:hypothetical protein
MAFRDITEGDIVQSPFENLLSFKANEDVKRGQLVKVAGEDIGVQPSDTDGEEVIGFATQTVSSGDMVTVATSGNEVKATSGTGAVSRGDYVASHGATGEEGEIATAGSGDFTIGQAIEDDVGTNDDVRIIVDLGGQVN